MGTLALAAAISLAAPATTATVAAGEPPVIRANHIKPENVIPAGSRAAYDVSLARLPAGALRARLAVVDYFGRERWSRELDVTADPRGHANLPQVDFVPEDTGYYELRVDLAGPDGKALAARAFSFGVAVPATRTAAQALAEGRRFGAKEWGVGDLWWRRDLTWDLAEAFDACALMGIHWTRAQFNRVNPKNLPGMTATNAILAKPIIGLLKVEGFPESCYDAERYGPIADFAKTHKRQSWDRWSVPKREAYVPWLQGQIEALPETALLFEVGNEPWGKITPAEWAEYCTMISDAIKAARPNAKVGTNIGVYDFDKAFLRAGGMAKLDFLAMHPYSFTPPPEQRVRAWMRNYRDWITREIGREIDWYTSEYGWSSMDPSRRYGTSEKDQARRTVRQSLMLYAENFLALIPHWMADREIDPDEREHWFGLFRLEGRPKPVIMAHAACARMIDGGQFLGDLPLGPGIGAMLFEKEGALRLALWTMDESEGAGRDVEMDVGDVGEVTLVDFMGAEKRAPAPGGKVKLRLNADVQYIMGVGRALAGKVIPPDGDLDPEQWLIRAAPERAIPRLAAPPAIDGRGGDWPESAKPMPLYDILNTNRPREDFSGHWKMAWDGERYYVLAEILDDQLGAAAQDRDALRLVLGPRPDRQMNIGGWDMYNQEFTIRPPAEGAPAELLWTNDFFDRRAKPVPPGEAGIEWAATRTGGGWTFEAALPWKSLEGARAPAAGGKLVFYAEGFDRDAGKQQLRLATAPAKENHRWPLLVLE